MDEEEKAVEQYLQSQGYESIIYEPDGNVPPDFLVDGKIAIEVRRLNQNYEGNATSTGLEEDVIPLYQMVNKILDEYSQRFIDKSYFVSLRFKRPIKKAKISKKGIKTVLSNHADSPKEERFEVQINENLSLRIFPASPIDGRFYLMAGYIDQDSGGYVLSEMERNIHICSEEKLKKVQKVRENYSIWWLALVDRISHGVSEDELSSLNSELLKGHDWDKVVLVNPLSPEKAYKI